ncbi:MAG: sodium pump decarboxylase [Lentisphaerae bacterium]|jgi:sodium pump decarboxylase gamma subunit|nr:sodium pump decarboxylase [Lentisphaerota bacterium]
MGLFAQGLILMSVGMVVVFFFLLFLYKVMEVASKIIPNFSYLLPDPEIAAAKPSGTAGTSSDVEIAIAIAVAAKKANR